jgi:hypothetical protein
MSKLPDAEPDQGLVESGDTITADTASPHDEEATGFDPPLHTVDHGGDTVDSALAGSPTLRDGVSPDTSAASDDTSLGETRRSSAISTVELVGRQVVADTVKTLPAIGDQAVDVSRKTVARTHDRDEGGEAFGAQSHTGDHEEASDEAGDGQGEPPDDIGDTAAEQGDDDPKILRLILMSRAQTRAAEIIDSLPPDTEHAPTIANGTVNLAIAAGVSRDPNTGANRYNDDILAEARTSVTALSDRMMAHGRSALRWQTDLHAEDSLDEETAEEMQFQISMFASARQEINSQAIPRILTAEAAAGSELAEGLLRSSVQDGRDRIEAKKTADPDYIVRPTGDRLSEERYEDFAEVHGVIKTAEALDIPVPVHVLAPEEPGDPQDFEVKLLLLEHDHRLAQPPPGRFFGDLDANARVHEGVADIMHSIEWDRDDQPTTRQLIATFPRLHDVIHETETKKLLTDHYLTQVWQDFDRIPMDVATYADIVDAACAVFDDPSMFDDPADGAAILDHFGSLINDAADQLRQAAEDTQDTELEMHVKAQIARNGAEWHARLSTFGTPPDETPVATAARVREDMERTSMDRRASDEMNMIYARELVKGGNPQAARALIELHTSDPDAIAEALTECLQVAAAPDPLFGRQPDRVEALRPGTLAMESAPDIAVMFEAAQAVTSDDITRIEVATRDIAQSVAEDVYALEVTDAKFIWVNTLLERADELSPAAGLQLRREVLPLLQASPTAGIYSAELLPIYRDLIRSGTAEDFQAIRKAMSRIGAQEDTIDQGLNTWAPLARMLARPPLQRR